MFASCLLAIGALGVVTQALPHDKARVEGVFRRQGCGNLQGPDVMFILDEARVDSWLPVNNTVFQVSQKAGTGGGHATGRQYLLVHFRATPFGSTGCELSWNALGVTGLPLEVKQSSAYNPPFRPTWNNVVVPSLSAKPSPVAHGTIVKTVCSNGPPPGSVGGGYGLAFIFKLADAVEAAGTAAATSFDVGGFSGPILRYGC